MCDVLLLPYCGQMEEHSWMWTDGPQLWPLFAATVFYEFAAFLWLNGRTHLNVIMFFGFHHVVKWKNAFECAKCFSLLLYFMCLCGHLVAKWKNALNVK